MQLKFRNIIFYIDFIQVLKGLISVILFPRSILYPYDINWILLKIAFGENVLLLQSCRIHVFRLNITATIVDLIESI